MIMPVLLTVKEVAELLGFSERTVYRLADSGTMPGPIKIGASVRWRKNELDQWIEEGCPANQKTAQNNSA